MPPDNALPGDLHVPIINLGKSYSCVESRTEVAEEIRKACLSSGFFYVTSHGIPNGICEGILDHAAKLFKTAPFSEKQRIHIQHSPHGYGWEPAESTSIAGDMELKEAYNWSYSEDLDPTGGDGLEAIVPGFYNAVRAYYGEALQLARHLCHLFAMSLRLPEDYFDAKVTHPSANSRIMFYPAGTPRGSDIGLGAHTDYQCFTILLCSSTPGLEILSPCGEWVQAPTVPGGLVVNIGDMMMRWTNGLYKSTIHRVVNRSGEERYSVPLFFGINNDELVETIPSCVMADRPNQYAPINAGEYILQRLAMTRKT